MSVLPEQRRERAPHARLAMPRPEEQAAPPPPATITAQPATINLVIYQGDDFYLDLTVTDAVGAAADLTGATASAQVRLTAGAIDPPAATFTATITTNVIHLHLPTTESTKLHSSAVWDCQIATPDITTLAAGTVTVTAQVTTP